ncbi:hypothetical protein [Streptomyces sp. C184]|uniref:hypothetical protein n=1 Tax=Streptomyces sp. C184 TaxID=3237121 RepID=UPI0034C66C9F
MRELLDEIETRRRLVREAAERLREQITLLGEQIAAVERHSGTPGDYPRDGAGTWEV